MASYDDLFRRDPEKLTLDQRLDLGCPPETLTPYQIAGLWAHDDPKSKSDKKHYCRLVRQIREQIERAITAGELRATERRVEAVGWPGQSRLIDDPYLPERRPTRQPPLADIMVHDIHRDDFQTWLTAADRWPLGGDATLSRWWPGEPAEAEPARTRRDALDDAIGEAETVLRRELSREVIATEVYDYLSRRDTTAVICDRTPAGLVWETRSGKSRTITLRALAKRLDRRRHRAV